MARHNFVTMKHPDLDRTIEVGHRSVKVHERSGWQVVDDPAPTKRGPKPPKAPADQAST